MAEREQVIHQVEPIWAPDARVLLLGTMPSPASRAAGVPYAHPQNRFWPVLATLFGEKDPQDPQGRRDLARRHHVAIWDVVGSCSIQGASDASIKDVVPNDVRAFVEGTQIGQVFLTGSTAARLYRKHLASQVGLPYQALPSTSPANARMRLPQLIEAYRPVAEAVLGAEPCSRC